MQFDSAQTCTRRQRQLNNFNFTRDADGRLCGAMQEMVEAAGVELFRVLTARKLLILQTATTAKKASLPDPLYVYCTKTFFRRCEWQMRQSEC